MAPGYNLISTALLLIFEGFAKVSGSPNDCPPSMNAKIQECVQPVALYASTMGFSIDKAADNNKIELFPNMGTHIFMELCNRIRRFDLCVQDARWVCDNHITLKLISSSYGYLCNQGYKPFMENADCLMRLDQDRVVKNCHDHTLGTIKAINDDLSQPLPMRIDKMCNSLNYFAQCVQPAVTTQCGLSAWSVIVKVLRDTTETLMPTCKFDASELPPVPSEETLTGSLVNYVNDAASLSSQRDGGRTVADSFSSQAHSLRHNFSIVLCSLVITVAFLTVWNR